MNASLTHESLTASNLDCSATYCNYFEGLQCCTLPRISAHANVNVSQATDRICFDVVLLWMHIEKQPKSSEQIHTSPTKALGVSTPKSMFEAATASFRSQSYR